MEGKMTTGKVRLIVVCIHTVCLLALPGCATPKAVLDLSTKSGENVSLVSAQLAAYADTQQQLAQQRAQLSGVLAKNVAEENERLNFQLGAMRLAGESDELAIYQGILGESDRSAQSQSNIAVIAQQEKDLILQSQHQLNVPQDQLGAVARALAELGTDLSFPQRVAFYGSYIASVNQRMNDLKKQADAAKAQMGAAVSNKVDQVQSQQTPLRSQ